MTTLTLSVRNRREHRQRRDRQRIERRHVALSLAGGDWTLSGANTYSGGTRSAPECSPWPTPPSGTGSGPVGSAGMLVVTGSVGGTVTVTGGFGTVNGSVGGSLNVTTGSAVVGGSVAGWSPLPAHCHVTAGCRAGVVTAERRRDGMINEFERQQRRHSRSGGGQQSDDQTTRPVCQRLDPFLHAQHSRRGQRRHMGGNTLTTVNGALTLNPNETVNIREGSGFGSGHTCWLTTLR